MRGDPNKLGHPPVNGALQRRRSSARCGKKRGNPEGLKKLKPRVRCVSRVINTGAGSPDFGLYSAGQFQSSKDSEPLTGQLPERGVIEVKGMKDNSWVTADGKQVSKYWATTDRS